MLPKSLPGHFIPIAGWLAASAAHDFVEGFEVRLRFPILKIAGSLQGRNHFRHGHGHELIDARSILAA